MLYTVPILPQEVRKSRQQRQPKQKKHWKKRLSENSSSAPINGHLSDLCAVSIAELKFIPLFVWKEKTEFQLSQ